MKPEVIRRQLRDLVKTHNGVPNLAKVLGVSKTSVYAWLRGTKDFRVSSANMITELWLKSQFPTTQSMACEADLAASYGRQIFLRNIMVDNEVDTIVICEKTDNPEVGSYVVCNDSIGKWTMAANAQINLVTMPDGSIFQIADKPDHVVLGKLVPIEV